MSGQEPAGGTEGGGKVSESRHGVEAGIRLLKGCVGLGLTLYLQAGIRLTKYYEYYYGAWAGLHGFD